MLVTSQNVTGASVEGFSRRRAELVVSQLAPNARMLGGTSFALDGFVRDYSRLVEQQRLQKAESVARTGVLVDATATLDSLTIDPASSVAPALNRFFSAAGALARETDTPSLRSEFRGAAEQLADRIRTAADAIESVRADAQVGLDETLAEANRLAGQLVELNRSIYAAGGAGGSGPSADLLDRRDLLLRDLRERVGGETRVEGDGTASVYVQGQPLVDRLVRGRIAVVHRDETVDAGGQLSGRTLPAGTVYLDFSDRDERGELTSDVRQPLALPSEGRAGAYATLLGEVVPRYAGALDGLAAGLADAVNGTRLADGSAITPVFDFRRDAGGPRLAKDMVSVVPTDVSTIRVDATAGKAIEAGPAVGTGTPLRNRFAREWASFVGLVSNDVLRWKSEADSSAAVGARLDAERERITGVNLDEEAANMVRFQQQYAAVSRVLQAGMQMFEELLGAMR
jgi:flagellar hook-associated protein 1 FlgK